MILTYYTIQKASKFCCVPWVYPRKDPLIITKVFWKVQIFPDWSEGYIKLFKKIIGIDPWVYSALRITGPRKICSVLRKSRGKFCTIYPQNGLQATKFFCAALGPQFFLEAIGGAQRWIPEKIFQFRAYLPPKRIYGFFPRKDPLFGGGGGGTMSIHDIYFFFQNMNVLDLRIPNLQKKPIFLSP